MVSTSPSGERASRRPPSVRIPTRRRAAGEGWSPDELSYQLDAATGLSGAARPEIALRIAADCLRALLRCDAIAWKSVDVRSHRASVWMPTVDWSESEARSLLYYAPDHPMVRSYLQDRRRNILPRRLSDTATRAELLRNRTYAEYLRPRGAEQQLTIATGLALDKGLRGWILNRAHPDFSDSERDTATALQPVLVTLERLARVTSTGASEPAPSESLTSREVEVLQLIGCGLKAQAVAHALRISTRTVGKHLENSYRKLGCHDRLIAVQRAVDLGLVTVAPRRPPG